MDLFDWYWLGVAVGLGVAAGVPGLPREGESRSFAVLLISFVAVATGTIAALVTLWAVFGTLAGLFVGVLSFRRLAPAAVPAAALSLAGLAFIPVLGYVEAAFAPFAGAMLRRRASARHAGLRILAKD